MDKQCNTLYNNGNLYAMQRITVKFLVYSRFSICLLTAPVCLFNFPLKSRTANIFKLNKLRNWRACKEFRCNFSAHSPNILMKRWERRMEWMEKRATAAPAKKYIAIRRQKCKWHLNKTTTEFECEYAAGKLSSSLSLSKATRGLPLNASQTTISPSRDFSTSTILPLLYQNYLHWRSKQKFLQAAC